MYRIEKKVDHLLVRFNEDFAFSTVQVVIHHLMRMKEYPDTNDIWLLGSQRALIRLGEIETMVNEFQCHCPRDATRTKTAIVVDRGLTRSIIELWVKALLVRVPFDIRIFESLDDAKTWLGVAEELVA